ncbi:CcdB family protein [Methylomagnum sp.]
MAQFHIHRNLDAGSRGLAPYLLDVQTGLLDELATRVVIPLRRASAYPGQPMSGLMPGFQIEGEDYLALTQQLAAISKKQIGASIIDVSDRRSEIMGALDLLISGF